MKPQNSLSSKLSPKWLWWASLGLIVLIALAAIPVWLPPLKSLADRVGGKPSDTMEESQGTDDHAAHDEAGHDESQSLELTPQARKNLDLETGEIELTDYARSLTVPAIVVERPEETTVKIAAPLTGVVTGLSVVRGEAVRSGKYLFTLMLTHEDLVQSQTDFLRLIEQLDVERKELARLEKITTGAIAQKTVLERQYEVDKLQAQLKAQGAALQLHGLSKEQVEHITQKRELLKEVKISAPFVHDDDSLHSPAEPETRHPQREYRQVAQSSAQELPHDLNARQFVVRTVGAQIGEAVQAGQMLCELVDYSKLYVEGRVFEQDAEKIVEAANQGRHVEVFTDNGAKAGTGIKGLKIAIVANEVDRESRAFHFYVDLPNQVVRDVTNSEGRHFLAWKYKPGQRMRVRVPVETWKDVIVLPVDAIAQEGPDTFVFIENGDHFDRKPVHVTYRDQIHAVVENDGSVFPGDMVAFNSAHQLQMALKNKAGGPVDPHAGHNH